MQKEIFTHAVTRLAVLLASLGLVVLLTGCSLPETHKSLSNYTPSEWVGLLTLLGFIFFVYMLPTVIALCSRHPSSIGIGLLNLTLGWSGIVWVATFIWAFIKPAKSVTVIHQTYTTPLNSAGPPPIPSIPPAEAELASLQRLKESELISDQEFASRRARILERF